MTVPLIVLGVLLGRRRVPQPARSATCTSSRTGSSRRSRSATRPHLDDSATSRPSSSSPSAPTVGVIGIVARLRRSGASTRPQQRTRRAAVLRQRLVLRPRHHPVHGRPRPDRCSTRWPGSTAPSSTAPSTASASSPSSRARCCAACRAATCAATRSCSALGPRSCLVFVAHPGGQPVSTLAPRRPRRPKRGHRARLPGPARHRAAADRSARSSSRCIPKRRPELRRAWCAILTAARPVALTLYMLVAVRDRRPRLPVRQLDDLGPVARHQVRPRRRRHLAVPRRAHRRAVPAGAVRGQARPRREGLLRLDHAARGRLPRRVPRPRPVPVLHHVRAHHRAALLPHRPVGPRPAGLRRHQVLPVHDVRLGRSCSCRSCTWRSTPRRARAARSASTSSRWSRPSADLDSRTLAPWLLPRLRHRLRGQDADLPVPHLAARRPHRGAHRRLGRPRRASCSSSAPTASCATASTCSPRPRSTSPGSS